VIIPFLSSRLTKASHCITSPINSSLKETTSFGLSFSAIANLLYIGIPIQPSDVIPVKVPDIQKLCSVLIGGILRLMEVLRKRGGVEATLFI